MSRTTFRSTATHPPLSSLSFRPVCAPATAQEILSWGGEKIGQGKEQRDILHRLVHQFREAHAWSSDPDKRLAYDNSVTSLQRVPHNLPDKEDILLLSSVDSYARIRQAGRVRCYRNSLTPQELKSLCREIRAALVWSSKQRLALASGDAN